LALVSIATVPAVVVGVAVALIVTGTTLNLQSFMGTIMAVGVSVANAILLVTFAERARLAGLSAEEAAVRASGDRLRPILMTGIAMIVGMLPLSLGLSAGGGQSAPLGRAVVGGLAASTLATLFILPAVFTVVQGRAPRRSASVDPFDPESPRFVGSRLGEPLDHVGGEAVARPMDRLPGGEPPRS
jgi:multidrug efflux pump subunit AcrB